MSETRKKFDRLKLRYGYLWNQLQSDPQVQIYHQEILKYNAPTVEKENQQQLPQTFDFLSAIESKKAIQINCCEGECKCSEPILEFRSRSQECQSDASDESCDDSVETTSLDLNHLKMYESNHSRDEISMEQQDLDLHFEKVTLEDDDLNEIDGYLNQDEDHDDSRDCINSRHGSDVSSSGSDSSGDSVIRFDIQPDVDLSKEENESDGDAENESQHLEPTTEEAKEMSRDEVSHDGTDSNDLGITIGSIDSSTDEDDELDENDNDNSFQLNESSDEAEWNGDDSEEESMASPKRTEASVIIVDDDSEISYYDDESSEENDIISVSDDSQDHTPPPSIYKRIEKKVDNTPKTPKPSSTVTFDPKSIQKTASKPKNFKRYREEITKSTFEKFDSVIFKGALSAVKVEWSSRMTSTAGLTRLRARGSGPSMIRIAVIELSTKLIDSEDRLRSTLCHEMCHAAQWLVDGVAKPPHGSVFKKWAQLSMRKVNGMLVTTTHDYVTNSFKFAWACTVDGCDFIIQRHSRSVDPLRHCCGKCRGKLIEIEVGSSKDDVAKNGFTPKKKRAASGFSLFVQAESSRVRSELEAESKGKTVTQSEVMKECGRLWREKKASTISNES